MVLAPAPGSTDRLVLTNRHGLLRGSGKRELLDRLIVVLPGRRQVPASVIAADPRSDLAVLRLELESTRIEESEVATIEFGAADEVRKGGFVLLLGNPYAVARDGSASVSLATVANLSRSPWRTKGRRPDDEDLTIHDLGTLWQLDSRINLGASGGAVVSFDGRLVGLTTALAAVEGYESSVGYAIPMNGGFRRIVESLKQGYEVEYGFLGIQPKPSMPRFGDLGRREAPPGAVVQSVADKSPAEVAGLVPDDVIVAVNGHPIRGDIDLVREIGLLGPDAVAELEVRRDGGEEVRIPVRLGKWPVYDDTQIFATQVRRPPWRGISIDYPTARYRYIMTEAFVKYPNGVVVTKVEPGSHGASAGLQEGLFITQVNNQPTPTPAQFDAAIRGATGDVFLRLLDGRELQLPE